MKSKEVRELQVSSSQLTLIFLAILAIASVIFLLGVSVGKKYSETQLEAEKIKTEALSEISAWPEKTLPEKKAEVTFQADRVSTPDEAKKESVKTEKIEPAQKKYSEDRPILKTEKPEISKIPEASKIAPETKSVELEAKGYFVQIAAFSKKEGLALLIQDLKNAGYQPFILDPFPNDKMPLYRVRIGPFKSQAEAEAARNRIKALIPAASNAFIVR